MPYTRRQLERILDADLIDASQMPTYAGRVAETYLKRQLFRWEDKAAREQLRLYREAFRDIRETAYAVRGRGGQIDRTWATMLFAPMRRRVLQLGRDVSQVAGRASATAYYAGYFGRAWLLDVSTRPDVRIDVRMPDLRDAMSGRILREAGPDVWAMIADEFGADWWRVFELEYDTLLINLRRVLNQGVREGLGMADIMDKVAAKFGLDMTPGGGYKSNFNVIQAITRTYVMNASNQGAADIYRQNADILAGMRHLTARDERVCSQCQGLEGYLYPLDEWNIPPGNTHPNCRCTVVPELRADYQDVYLTGRDEPPRETFGEWAANMGVGLVLGAFLGATV